jgi:hypothetical protein
MKLQAITTIAVLTGIISTTTADAGKFNLGDALRVAQKINQGPNFGGGKPVYKPLPYPGNGGGKPIHKPLPHPGHGGGKPPVCKPKPPVCKPPVHLPTPPPVYHPQPPVCKPKPPVCPPVYKPQPPVCKKPGCECGVCKCQVCKCHKPGPPVCKPPINRPPVKCYTMKLINDAGAEVFFSIDGADYQQLANGDFEMVKSHNRQPHLISYHNGIEVVEFELDPSAIYGFEWQGDTLMLLEIQG